MAWEIWKITSGNAKTGLDSVGMQKRSASLWVDRDRLRSSVAEQLGLPTAGLPRPDTKTDAFVTVLLTSTVSSGRV
jgi:formate-dependent phosphoribosylglycinamide formyltransferase (GAR transformylase)